MPALSIPPPRLTAHLLLGVAWLLWATLVPLPLKASTSLGRVELQAQHLEAVVGGRVVESRLRLGERVQAGDVLVTLETSELEAQLQAEEATFSGLSGERAALVLQDRERSSAQALRVARAAALEAEATAEAAATREALARSAADRHQDPQSTTAWEREQLQSRYEQARLDTRAARAVAAQRQAEVQRVAAEARRAQAALAQEQARLEGALEASGSRVAGAEARLARAQLRAPVAGRVAEAAPLGPGDTVTPGERVGTLLPDGELRVAAAFTVESLGRLRRGQRAQMRVEAFDWTRFGTLPLVVDQVASEPRHGLLRVELVIDGETTIPLEHGLVGDVEVEVERTTFWTLLLRAIGAQSRPAA